MDEQSISRESVNKADQVTQLVPDKVKWMGLGLGAVFLCFIFWIFSGPDKESPVTKNSFETKADKATNKTEAEPEVPIHSGLSEINALAKNKISFKEKSSSSAGNIIELGKQVQQMKREVDLVMTKYKALNSRLEESILMLNKQVSTQERKIQQLELNVSAKTAKTKALYKKTVRRHRKQILTVPFKLVSIDQWGAEVYAVVRDEKMRMLHELTVGQGALGWRVISINRNRGMVVLVNEKGVNKELFLKS